MKGQLSTREALSRLLAGSGLSYQFVSPAAVRIVSDLPISSAREPAPIRVDMQAPAAPAAAAPAPAPAAIQEVVVTGSRTITNGNNSPTPITVVSVAQLQTTTPSTVADGLNKLPEFMGSRTATTTGNGTTNAVGNFLNLRGFGVIRTLILEDGRRVPASAQDGTVDTNTLPDMLVQRVDVVTGGASAVYGSDAVTGVVNYVLDHNFNGVKLDIEGGDSSRNDDGSWRFGIAGGRAFMDGRLHVEGSYEHYNSDGVDNRLDRPTGAEVACVTGAGTYANPYVLTQQCRVTTSSFGGASEPNALYSFDSNGVLGPFIHGTKTGTSTTESGGDGQYTSNAALAASLKYDQLFARADYDFSNDVRGFAQVSATRSTNADAFGSLGQTPSPYTFYATNPFLTPAQAATLSGGAPTFTFLKKSFDDPSEEPVGITTSIDANIGLEGKLGSNYDWSVYYTHGQTTLHETDYNNINFGRLDAALDAVVNPANGQIVCNVTLVNPNLYPGCVPLNWFGPTADKPTGMSWVVSATYFDLNNYMDDVGGTVSGNIVQDWAGPVRVAVTAEDRQLRMTVASPFSPTATLSCTGLRINCTPGVSLEWGGKTLSPMAAQENVAEGALEATVPVLKDVFLAQSFEMNGAVRFAHYSISGDATTWKIGGDWHVNDELTFRGTRSQDIRAPTLNDLYAPVAGGTQSIGDTHTGVSAFTYFQSQGNPNLVPEVAETWTAGVVFRPQWLPRFSVSVDYYNIDMNNAITSVAGSNVNYDALCDQSGGTSPYCALYVRPLPFSNTTAANFPTLLLTESLNVAKTWMNGVDTEVNYGFLLEDLYKPAPGRVDLRLLLNYQPNYWTLTIPGTPALNAAGAANGYPSFRATLMGDYSVGPWRFDVETRWRAALRQNSNPALIFDIPPVPAVAFTDVTATYNFKAWGQAGSAFLSVQNVFDQIPPIWLSNSTATSPGLSNPAVPGDDLIGRYFTAGVRMRF